MQRSTALRLSAFVFSLGMLAIVGVTGAGADESVCHREFYCVGEIGGTCVYTEGTEAGCEDGPFCLGGSCCHC